MRPAVRSRGMGELYNLFHRKNGVIRASSSQDKIDPDYPRHVAQVAESIARVRDMYGLLALAEWLVRRCGSAVPSRSNGTRPSGARG